MEIYLDNSATTRVYESVRDVVSDIMFNDYGNPSSIHIKGYEAEKHIKNARTILAGLLKVNEKEIYFTSGGTESNNLAVIGGAMANQRRGKHLITTEIEHPSVLAAMKYLEGQGFAVTYLKTENNGSINPEDLKNAIKDDTILVSVMFVNNEIGSLQPVWEIGEIIKSTYPEILFHIDAVQAFGKYQINPKKLNADLVSVSGHKIHGPKGTGFLYIKSKTKIKPILFGGGQQEDIRPGTENVPGIVGLAQASKEIYSNFKDDTNRLYALKDYFINELSLLEGVKINSVKGKEGSPHIVSVSFKGIKSEVMLHSLEDEKIYVSSGSACSSNKKEVSKTLKNINLEKEYIDGTIRFSFSNFTTKEELEKCIEVLKSTIPKLRLYKHY